MLSYRFRDGVHVRLAEDGVVITTPYATRWNAVPQSLYFEKASDSLRALLRDLSREGVGQERFVSYADASPADSDQLPLRAALEDFYLRGLLSTEISGSQGIAMSLDPVKPWLPSRPAPPADCRIKFSRLVSIQPSLEGLRVSTPVSAGAIHLKDQRVFQILLRLVAACDAKAISTFLPEDLRNHDADVVSLLLSSGVAGVCDGEGVADIDRNLDAAGWTCEDLTFHRHTREQMIDLCRNSLPQKVVDKYQFPAKYQRIILSVEALPKPSHLKNDLGFFQVIHKRKTIRAYQEKPINAGLLSDFLWHSMHVREEILCDPGLPRAYPGLLRPVASAGALHSIELYLCINRCIGLPPGFYHYDTSLHSLGKLSGLVEPCLQMLDLAAASTCRAPQAASVSPGQGQRPDVLVVMAARYGRNASLHHTTGLTYALILKDVGAIYQQFYLVATALRLAPCGLSFGSSELLEQASGLPADLECSVGEFMIGNPP